MTDLPGPFTFNIFAAESFGSGVQVGATILSGDTDLRGLEGWKKAWSLSYIDTQKGICTLSDIESGGFLGLPTFSVNMDPFIRRVKEAQEWTLKKTQNGYSISRVLNGKEWFWHLNNEGGKIRIAPSSQGIQSWVFKPLEG